LYSGTSASVYLSTTPTRRSSDLPAGDPVPVVAGQGGLEGHHLRGHLGVGDPGLLPEPGQGRDALHMREELRAHLGVVVVEVVVLDRKSTRLNSSHVSSSYAVFCL